MFRLPRPGTKIRILLGLCIALAIVAALFDWNWFRHPFEQYLIERSHREIRIGDLHVDLGWSLEPTVRVRNVYVENAPWADKQPAALAGEASFTFSLKSLWQGRAVISRLVLIDADIDLERQADGLRNWRLRNPADRGPGRVKVLRLEPHRTKIRFIRRDIDFEVVLTASSAEPGASGQPPDASHPTRIHFKGEFGGTGFSGDVLTGELLTFLETGETFPLRGHASAGKSRLDVDGVVADLFRPSAMDAKVRLAGPSLSKLESFMRVSLPDSRPYEVETRLRQTNDEFFGTGLRAKVGGTDLAGDVSFNRSGERPMLRAKLRSDAADLSDLGSLLGLGHAPGQAAATSAAGKAAAGRAEEKPSASGRILPSAKINLEHLNALDAHVSLDARKLTASGLPALDSLRFSVALENGILILKPIHVGLAGGQVTGWLTLDGQQQPATAQAKLELQGIRLEKLLATLPDVQFNAGTIAARLDLRGHGASVATILGVASGTLAITMDGGRISNLLDAKLGLNVGKVLRLLVAGDRAIEINSLDVAFDFDKGSGTSTNIILDTAQTRVTGTGKINLRDETVDLLLTPFPKKPGVFSLRSSSIHVDGSFRHPQFEIVEKSE